MTTTIPIEPRRTVAPPREMPVLFHLLDVSRPKESATSPAEEPQSASNPPAELLALPVELPPAPPSKPLPPVLPPIESTLVAAPAVSPEPIAAAAPAESPVESPVASSESLAAETTPTETPPPPADEAVSLRQRMEERSRKRQTPSQGSWFTPQGKFIAIAFVLALCATIYLARSRRPAAAPPVTTTHAHPGAAAGHGPAIVIEMPKTTSPAKAMNSPAKAVAAKVEVAKPQTEAEQQVELQAPTTTPPQLAEQPAPPAQPADEGLFPWKDREEARVAARPDPPALTTSPTYAPLTPPTDEPRYPVINPRSQFQPALQAAQPSPPPAAQTAPGPQLPQTAGPASAPARNGEPTYPTTNSARGIRYERTGSGLY